MVDEVRPRLHAHGDGVFTAYIPYRLLYEFDAAEHPDGPMNPYGGVAAPPPHLARVQCVDGPPSRPGAS
jgi:hypothetical protein